LQFARALRMALRGLHLGVELRALGLSALALAAGFPVERGGRQLHLREPLDHGARLGHRQLAHRQRRDLLHAGGITSGVL
jgi:hypothetical protein